MELIKRTCPICDSANTKELCRMNTSTLLKSNTGYNSKWFEHQLGIKNHSFPFVRCTDCNFVYSLEKLNDELTIKYYNEGIDAVKSEAKIYKSAKRKNLLIWWNRLLNLSNLDSPIKVLDYGAGWGDFLAVAKCIGVEVFGLEFDQRKIDFAQRNGIPCGDFSFIEKHAPYDIFMCNQVLEHLDRPKESLIALRKILKIGAVGFVSVPNFPIDVINKQIKLIEQGELPSKDFDPLGHLNYFDGNSFRRMIEEAGFEEIKKPTSKSIRRKLNNFLKRQKDNQSLEEPSLFIKAI